MLNSRPQALAHMAPPLGLTALSFIVCGLTLLLACGGEPNVAPTPLSTPLLAPTQIAVSQNMDTRSSPAETTSTPLSTSLPAPTQIAVSQNMDTRSSPAETTSTPLSTSLPASTQIIVSQAFNPPSSLDELIVLSDIIARVSLLSVERHTMVDFRGSYLPALKFRFRVVEYLKGNADTEIAVEVPLELDYVITDVLKAESIADELHDGRDRTYEDREAIVFLIPSRQGEFVWSEGPSTMYRFTGPHEFPMYTNQYAITSDYNRAWLPATNVGGASGASDPTELTYLTGVPPAQSQGASGAVSSTPPSVSLSEINRQIEMHDNLLYDGRDIPGYVECIEASLRHAAEIKAQPRRQSIVEREIPSGQPEGHKLWPVSKGRSGDPFYEKWWITGPDSHLFEMRMTDDDNDPTTGYAWDEVATRPVPSGTYTIFYKNQPTEWVPCDYNPELHYSRYKGEITVEEPAGTLHEAFFDPVGIGTAVGSDADNGVLEPASFRLEGVGKVSIDRIEWESGGVEIELDPHSASGFANHHIDFIALDGSITLRLDFDDAAEVERDGTRALSWNVCDQPWESGDLLMLRMSASQSELTDVTNDGPCSPPQNLAATSTHDSVTLTWDAPDDATVSGHRILRRLDLQETFTQFDVDGATTTTYVDTSDIQPATKYIYRVHAVNDSGISDMVRVAVTTLAPPPQNLAATSTHDSVTLTWDAPDDATVSGYRIFRRQPGQDTFVQFDVSGASSTTYVDTMGIEPGTRYIYRVHAVYLAGLSDVARVTVTTHTAP